MTRTAGGSFPEPRAPLAGVALGVAVGVAVGVALGNIAVGVGVGAGVGVVFALAARRRS